MSHCIAGPSSQSGLVDKGASGKPLERHSSGVWAGRPGSGAGCSSVGCPRFGWAPFRPAARAGILEAEGVYSCRSRRAPVCRERGLGKAALQSFRHGRMTTSRGLAWAGCHRIRCPDPALRGLRGLRVAIRITAKLGCIPGTSRFARILRHILWPIGAAGRSMGSRHPHASEVDGTSRLRAVPPHLT